MNELREITVTVDQIMRLGRGEEVYLDVPPAIVPGTSIVATQLRLYRGDDDESSGMVIRFEVVVPHTWDGTMWTCTGCGQRKPDPCDCSCHPRDDVGRVVGRI